VAPVTYFEASFLEQVEAYSSLNIQYIPHGAQLTGMAHASLWFPYWNSSPGAIAFRRYFGSLATSSGLHHSYFYMCQGNEMKKTL
jgi:hypothetical protein